MVAGQVSDIEAETNDCSNEMLEYIHINKTAALIKSAIKAGLYLGNPSSDMLSQLDKYAENLGLAYQIADDILERLSEVSSSELSIPVGTLTGSSLLAGRGPSIHVRMQAVGSAKASLRNAFTSAGINQTRHQVLLDVSVTMSILLPGFITDAQVTSEIAVAETVIVGGVPNTYTYFSTTPDEVIDYADEYIMNNG